MTLFSPTIHFLQSPRVLSPPSIPCPRSRDPPPPTTGTRPLLPPASHRPRSFSRTRSTRRRRLPPLRQPVCPRTRLPTSMELGGATACSAVLARFSPNCQRAQFPQRRPQREGGEVDIAPSPGRGRTHVRRFAGVFAGSPTTRTLCTRPCGTSPRRSSSSSATTASQGRFFFFGRARIGCCHATQFVLSFYFLK
jgi:hypothetical protein